VSPSWCRCALELLHNSLNDLAVIADLLLANLICALIAGRFFLFLLFHFFHRWKADFSCWAGVSPECLYVKRFILFFVSPRLVASRKRLTNIFSGLEYATVSWH
jgi:hypothetical protein